MKHWKMIRFEEPLITKLVGALVVSIFVLMSASSALGAWGEHLSRKGADVSQRRLVISKENNGENIRLELDNRSDDGFLAVLPLILSPSNRVGGVEYEILDSDGRQIYLCGLANPISAPSPILVGAKSKFIGHVSVKFLADIFCLSDGVYVIRASFHNIWKGKELSETLDSNELEITIEGRKKRETEARKGSIF
jgi:hypothetical protein